MNWSALVLRASPGELLGKADGEPFSKPQTLAALLAWFAALPADLQARAVRDYLASRGESALPDLTAFCPRVRA
jgi:hypothetical protein